MARPSGSGRTTVAGVPAVRVAELARRGLLQAETWSGSWSWSSGSSAALVVDRRELVLLYSAGGQDRRDAASVEWVPCPFGGERPWLRCPRCCRRCAAVYLRPSGAACRRCHRLPYPSQRQDSSSRAHLRGARLMRRLGATGQDAYDLALNPGLATKPRRMRWATFGRIVREARALEDARILALLPAMERFFKRVGMKVPSSPPTLQRTGGKQRPGPTG